MAISFDFSTPGPLAPSPRPSVHADALAIGYSYQQRQQQQLEFMNAVYQRFTGGGYGSWAHNGACEPPSFAAWRADRMQEAMGGAGTDEDTVLSLLESSSPAQLRSLEAAFRLRHGGFWQEEGGTLDAALGDELSDQDLVRARLALTRTEPGCRDEYALRQAGETRARMLNNAISGSGTNEETIFRVLEGATPEELRATEDAFREHHGEQWEGVGGTLQGALRDDLSDAEYGRAMVALSRKERVAGDPGALRRAAVERADALHEAMAGGGTDEDAIYRVLESSTPQELRATQQLFAERHGNYWKDEGGDLQGALRDELSGDELARALRAFAG